MRPAFPSSQRPLPLFTVEEAPELQGHPSPGNGAGVKIPLGDLLDIPEMNHSSSSQVPIPSWVSVAVADVREPS